MAVTAVMAPRRRRLSIVLIAASITASAAVALAVDVVLVRYSTDLSARILLGAVIFNGTGIMQSVVGGIIEWRRPGHAIGRLMMLAGPLYAIASAGWTIGSTLETLVDPEVYRVFSWTVTLLSWPAVALIAGWIPILFPTGTLPGPRWRVPAAVLLSLTSVGLIAMSLRPGPPGFAGVDLVNPFGIEAWPGFLQPFVDAVPFTVLGSLLLAMVAVISRYRRGDRVVRLQIRWFVAAVAIVPVSLLGILVELGLRAAGAFDGQADAPNGLAFAVVSDAGILAMPIAIGIAVTRYRLYEIDRLISRTIAYAAVTATIGAIFTALLLVLTALMTAVAAGETIAVAASTLVAFALFQPVRRRVQGAVDRRFDRSRYDADATVRTFAGRLRGDIDLRTVCGEIVNTASTAVRPATAAVWLRGPRP